jgi:peroxiredoxin
VGRPSWLGNISSGRSGPFNLLASGSLVNDLRKNVALVLAGAVSLFLAVQYIRLLEPAAAREVQAACNGLRPARMNPTLGPLPAAEGTYPRALPFQVQDHTGKLVSLEDYRGKVVLVNFWASWCKVCAAEKPGLERLQRRFGRDDVVVLSLASDADWAPVRKVLSRGSDLTVLLDPPDDDGTIGAVAKSYGIKAVPETFVIDRKGHVRHYFINKRDWDSKVAETCVRSLIHE